MTAVKCLCGFTENSDEQLADHLYEVFEPGNLVGTDGKVHEELDGLTCACGLKATAPEALDEHLLSVFTPADGIGRDRTRHGAALPETSS
jgi:hypothetical protein